MYSEFISRNIGIVSKEEQEILHTCSVGIAGIGGIGGLLAERLIRIGFGQIKISDPGVFELSNLNRQYGSTTKNLNKKKVDIIAAQLNEINPECTVVCEASGITDQKSADLFVRDISIVIDEMDYGMFIENIFLNRAARKKGIYYLFSSALGFGGLVAIFSPHGMSLEEYNGFHQGNLSQVQHTMNLNSTKLTPYLPSYTKGKEHLINKMIGREAAISANSIGVGLAAIMTANEIVNLLLNKTPITEAPQCFYIDLMDKVLKIG